MKNIIVLFSLILYFCSCSETESKFKENSVNSEVIQNPISASGDSDFSNLPKFHITEKEHNFGTMIQGEKVAWIFKYKNTGNSDLIISRVKTSCGCTVPTFSKEPLSSGKEGELEIVFDSAGRKGNVFKTITVFTNAQPNAIKLAISGQIIIPN